MQKLIRAINQLKKSPIKKTIDSRIQEFKQCKNHLSELCFCILTANYTAEGGIRIQQQIGNGFKQLTETQLSKKLKKLKYRFPNKRANYIINARKHSKIAQNREWLVKNIKGLGYKEASHYLRNTGQLDYAIIDFHIIDLLAKHKIITPPKTLTPKKYLEIEQKLKQIAKKTGLSLGELDLYLWHMETGKVLK